MEYKRKDVVMNKHTKSVFYISKIGYYGGRKGCSTDQKGYYLRFVNQNLNKITGPLWFTKYDLNVHFTSDKAMMVLYGV